MNKGIFLIHGFLGGKGEMDKLIEYLNEGGYFVYAPRLSGHANNQNIPSFSFWIKEIEMHYLQFVQNCENVYIIGFSMGGVLASYLALRHPKMIKGIVFINAAFKHVYFDNIHNVKGLLSEFLIGVKKGFRVKNMRKQLIYSVQELRKLTLQAEEQNWLSKINKPCLIIQGKKDGFILSDTPYFIYRNLKNDFKEIKFYNTRHSFWLAKEFPLICQDIIIFIEALE